MAAAGAISLPVVAKPTGDPRRRQKNRHSEADVGDRQKPVVLQQRRHGRQTQNQKEDSPGRLEDLERTARPPVGGESTRAFTATHGDLPVGFPTANTDFIIFTRQYWL